LPGLTSEEIEPGWVVVVVGLAGAAGCTVVGAGLTMAGLRFTGPTTPEVADVPPPLDGTEGEVAIGAPAPLGALAGVVLLAVTVPVPTPDAGDDVEARGGKYGIVEGGREVALLSD
jgi:hypothetical protein